MNNVFQSSEWEKLKLATGYAKSYRVDDILILQRNLPLGFSMLYSPMVSQAELDRIMNTESGIKNFLAQIETVAKQNKTIFYRLELDVPVTNHDSKFMIHDSAFGFAKSFEEMQPEHTLILDLTKSEEEILAQMKPKGRYNIKIAQKISLAIKKSDKPGATLDDFYQLYSATGKRHGITFRSKQYFDSLLEILGKSGYALLYTIYLDQNDQKIPLASAIILYSDRKAIYLFGASSDEYKNLMAPYRLHFEIIKEAKTKGCAEYDFFGIAPADSPDHPWAGVTRFKKQFGGAEQQIVGSYDLVFKPASYQLFKFAEKIRR